jgi:hypothetical protein
MDAHEQGGGGAHDRNGQVPGDNHTLREKVASNRLTFVLLPTLEMETCVAETVCRQLSRSFARSREREEHVIRTRFAAGVLPLEEAVEAMSDEAFRALDHLPRYQPDGVARLQAHLRTFPPYARATVSELSLHVSNLAPHLVLAGPLPFEARDELTGYCEQVPEDVGEGW